MVYASNNAAERLTLWDNIRSLQTDDVWIVGGDFNNMLRIGEHVGGHDPLESEFEPFADCLSDCSLEDMRGRGCFFTWTNKTIRSKIDRVLVNPKWMETFPAVKVFFAQEQLSDHTRSIVQFNTKNRKRKTCFRFCNMWCLDANFLPIVTHIWHKKIRGSIMFQIAIKL